jgi:hypothetical protein
MAAHRSRDRLGLRPAGKQETVSDPGRPVVSGLAKTSQPDRDLTFRARQYAGSVDPVVGVFDDREPQTEQTILGLPASPHFSYCR